jgi:tRNA threonylcarbamoyladenosine biosynthesis protein TsaB
MLLLALDTTTAAGSVALWRDGLLEQRSGHEGMSHAQRLPGDLVDLLARHGATVADVTGYAVAAGPGSFTGLRVGIATIQGLALVYRRRVHAIGTLDLLAHQAATSAHTTMDTTLVAWMDAYRGEVFAARYRVIRETPVVEGRKRPGGAILERLDEPVVGPPGPIAEAWARAVDGGPVLVNGDAVVRTEALLRSAFGSKVALWEPSPLAHDLAALAAAAPDDGVRPHAIVPIYVRRPDVELARDRAAVRPTA